MNILEIIKYCNESKQQRRTFKPNEMMINPIIYKNNPKKLFMIDFGGEEIKELSSSDIFDIYEFNIKFEEIRGD